jgi:hypothetical protein
MADLVCGSGGWREGSENDASSNSEVLISQNVSQQLKLILDKGK